MVPMKENVAVLWLDRFLRKTQEELSDPIPILTKPLCSQGRRDNKDNKNSYDKQYTKKYI